MRDNGTDPLSPRRGGRPGLKLGQELEIQETAPPRFPPLPSLSERWGRMFLFESDGSC